MLEILVLLAVIATPIMAKSRKRRRYSGNFRAVRVKFDFTIGTLASGVMITNTLGLGTGNEYWAISVDLALVLENVTPFTGGPLAFGFCHGDYSVAELDEWYEATGTLAGDQIEIEEGRRKVRDGGIMGPGNPAASAAIDQHFNDGRVKRFKLGFRVESGKTTNVWVRNMGGSSYATTVPTFRGYGKMFVRLL